MLVVLVFPILFVGVNCQFRLELQRKQNLASDVRKFYSEFYDQLRTRGLMLSNNYPRDSVMLKVEIGQPTKTFNLAIGLDSPTTWILDRSYANLTAEQQSYNADGSSTSKLIKSNGFVVESPHKINGNIYLDQMQLTFDNNLKTSFKQNFGVVQKFQRIDGIPFSESDGFFSLMWNEIEKSPIIQLMEHVNASRQVFTLSLGRTGGSLLLGDLDNERCRNDINFVPLVFNPISQMLTFKLDSFKSGLFSMNGQHAMLDIGFPFIQMPGAAYQAVYEQNSLEYNWELNLLTVPCNKNGISDWIFSIGGHEYILKSKDFVIDIQIGDGMCAFALDYNFDPYTVQFILGNPFMRVHCSTLDVERQMIGFSKSINE